MEQTRVTHLTHSVSRSSGGLFESVRHLSKAVAGLKGFHVSVLGLADEFTEADISIWEPVATRALPVFGSQRFGFAPGLLQSLRELNADVVHLHGLWKYPSVAALKWVRQSRKPLLISPHGMLEPWSLTQSRLKKLAATWLYQGACFRAAGCIRATSELEARGIAQAGYRNPIAIIPNGVVVPAVSAQANRNGSRPRQALFLSRIHPKKGLLNLVAAWATVRPAGWRLVIAGPDECNHLAEVKSAVVKANLQQEIAFKPEVWGEAKYELYRESDLFVFPSYSENFGLVVAESLACGTPVITTRATPWEELVTDRCGWWIDVGIEPLVEALRVATSCSPELVREMGVRARELVVRRYSWENIAAQTARLMEWMLGRRPRPDFVTV